MREHVSVSFVFWFCIANNHKTGTLFKEATTFKSSEVGRAIIIIIIIELSLKKKWGEKKKEKAPTKRNQVFLFKGVINYALTGS